MAEACPICLSTFGKRRRCYICSPGKKRTGELRACSQCGTAFYAQRNQIADTARNGATYCSVPCKARAQAGRPSHRRAETRLAKHRAGYLLEWAGHEHPAAHNGRVLQHRRVMERALGRYLTSDEHVHHINGDKTDNRLENLRLMTPTEHQALHAATDHIQSQPRRIELVCKRCGQSYERRRSKVAESNYCSAACRLEVQHDAARAYWAARRAGKE